MYLNDKNVVLFVHGRRDLFLFYFRGGVTQKSLGTAALYHIRGRWVVIVLFMCILTQFFL